MYRLSLRVGDKQTRTADIRHRDPATGEPGTESPPFARLFGLKNAGFYGRSATPGCRRRHWGDLVVPTGWRRWGRSMDFLSFCRISFKGLKRDSASSCSQGST
ncbi:hypothetical protein Ahy_A07g032138 [Arachis hypogaea]|uniref:Uncharacterized protein n=1 Tax=Arachis hypogaea TaxID=3818 RepID=A0A445C6A0_ARAHY|nr:hypothetical protein Ahy_A07g032138 [Arachis hypogaea]